MSMTEFNDRRTGDRRVADPCLHSAELGRIQTDIVEIRSDVRQNAKEIQKLSTNDAETKVYMRQVLDGVDKLTKALDYHMTTGHSLETSSSLKELFTPQLLDLIKWLIIIICGFVGYKISG